MIATLEVIYRAVRGNLETKEFENKLDGLGSPSAPGSIEAFVVSLQADDARWGKIIREASVKLD